MAVPGTARRFGLYVFLACVAIAAAGVWYAKNGGWWEDEQDIADDDEEPADFRADGGAHRRRPKKTAPHSKRKASEARQGRGGNVRHGSGEGKESAARESTEHGGPTGPSYESAIAGNNLNLAPGTKDVPDLTDAELAGPMRDGTFLDACGVPGSTHVTVKVAIRNGRAVGISVYPTPPSQDLAGCIERHVRRLQWPSNAKMDSFITTY